MAQRASPRFARALGRRPAVTRSAAAAAAADSNAEDGLSTLTRREREILDLLGSGASNVQIATALVISENTVKVHVRHILEKLDARNRFEAVLKVQRAASYAAPDLRH